MLSKPGISRFFSRNREQGHVLPFWLRMALTPCRMSLDVCGILTCFPLPFSTLRRKKFMHEREKTPHPHARFGRSAMSEEGIPYARFLGPGLRCCIVGGVLLWTSSSSARRWCTLRYSFPHGTRKREKIGDRGADLTKRYVGPTGCATRWEQANCRARNGFMSHLAHLVSSAFKVREVPPLCTSSECNKARSRAISAADMHLGAQPVGQSMAPFISSQERAGAMVCQMPLTASRQPSK